MRYVVHYCKNPKCNNCWIDKDETNVKTYPPTWKYCKECCKELGIDFNNQKKPELTDKQKDAIKKNLDKKSE